MEKNEDSNPWSLLPNEIEDILLREVFPRLTWDDIICLSMCRVNKAWRALFSKDSLWKSVLQTELAFVDLGEGSNYYKKFIDALASFKRFGCGHPAADVSTAVRVCPCVLPFNFNSDSEFTIFYTDYKNEYILKTDECKCHEKISTREHLLFPLICKECDEELRNNIYVAYKRGTISQQRKWVNACWIHKELELPEDLLVAKPIPNSDNIIAITNGNPKWLTLLRINDGIIHKEDLIEVTGDSLHISNDGKYVAVYTRYGLQGFVYDLHDKKTTFNFERASYHPNHCSFPVAFFTYEKKEYLIAGKAWNRIDLYDPETGQSLKERDVSKNHLEYFWSTLYVSPDQKSLVSFGWVWHPIGICTKFSIENWMTNNIYAMEKGEKTLSEGFDWDYPICWIDNNTIAVWGDSNNNQDHGMPVVRSIDVRVSVPDTDNTKKKHELFAPMEEYPMEFDEYIISLNPKGIELIDVNDSHSLEIPNKQQVDRVLCYNKHNKQVVSIKKKNESFVLVLSHIHYNDK